MGIYQQKSYRGTVEEKIKNSTVRFESSSVPLLRLLSGIVSCISVILLCCLPTITNYQPSLNQFLKNRESTLNNSIYLSRNICAKTSVKRNINVKKTNSNRTFTFNHKEYFA